ncbi:MAG: gamma-glutamyltransferase family protein [Planctomycetota bacterium]|nr:gamma-glutamyltransferase family protein [Planctomycetota bacterium]
MPAGAWAGDRISGRAHATRSEVLARHALAATSQPLATQVALEILRAGGSAVDAAIAANATLGLMEPTGCGVGGDLFAMVWDPASNRLHGLNGSGRSPKALTREHLLGLGLTQIPAVGPLPVSVPGCVDGWFALHAKFGKLPMAQVLAPAIRYAREGFPVSELIAWYWARGGPYLADQPGFATTFLPGGRAPAKGDLFRNEGLARTYEALATGGRAAFYEGALAETIDTFCRSVGCFLRKEDLAAHRSTWVEPVSVNYRGYDVWELPPNGQGIAALQMLGILEGFKLAGFEHNSAPYLHHLIEAKKLAYEDRARFYADPEFMDVAVADLLSDSYATRRRALLDPARAARTVDHGDPKLRQGDTIYLTVADESRMMVSLIQSNYRGFGSGLCPPGLGFCLQDRGEMFHLGADHPNGYAPGKRPFHTIIPGFVTKDGKPWLSFGVMGGDMQPQGHVQVLLNLIDFGMNVQEAGDAARFHHTGSSEPTGERMTTGGELHLESAIGAEVRAELTRRGHVLRDAVGGYGGYQAIHYDAARDLYVGASESRKDGQAAGY